MRVSAAARSFRRRLLANMVQRLGRDSQSSQSVEREKSRTFSVAVSSAPMNIDKVMAIKRNRGAELDDQLVPCL